MKNAKIKTRASRRIKYTVPAVVLGLGVNGLGVVRSLGKRGVPVLGVYTKMQEAGRLSRFCNSIQFPVLEDHELDFLNKLMELGKQSQRLPLIPTSDEFVQFMSKHRAVLEKYFRFNIADEKTLDMIIKKNGTQELADRCGIPIPKALYPTSMNEVDAACKGLKFPCIIKPLDTFSVKLPEGEKNIIINHADQLMKFYQNHPHFLGQTVVQEIVKSGDGNIFICAGYFNAQSEPLALYTGRKIRQYPPDFGVTCLGESSYLPELEMITVGFLKKIGFRGLMAAEYAKDMSDGSFYFIEINARSYYHNQLFTDCGINLAYITYRDLMGEEVKPNIPRQKDGIRWLDFQRDLSSCWRKRKKNEIFWSEWFTSIIRSRSFAYLNLGDMKPYFYATYLFMRILFQKAGQGLSKP